MYVNAVIALVKMFISMVHLYVAMHNVARFDNIDFRQKFIYRFLFQYLV